MKRWLQFLKFIFFEVFVKSISLCFIATFIAYLMLYATPKVEPIKIPIRGEEVSNENKSEITLPVLKGQVEVHEMIPKTKGGEIGIMEAAKEDIRPLEEIKLNNEGVRKVQEALASRGYNPGPADGVFGKKTRKAIKEFQKNNRLKVTGTLNQATLSKLGVQLGPEASINRKLRGQTEVRSPISPAIEKELTNESIPIGTPPQTEDQTTPSQQGEGVVKGSAQVQQICKKSEKSQETVLNFPKTTTEKGDQNFLNSYIEWINGLFHWELGRTKAGQKVTEEIKERLPITFVLSFASFLPAILISFLLGLSMNKDKINILKGLFCLFTALPAFFLGYLLIALFGYHVCLLPRYLLAIFTLALSSGIINEMSRVIENAMEIELSKEYIETAKAKGLANTLFPRIGTVGFHAFRNALITILPQLGSIFTFIISGSMVVEQVFDLPGLSFMLLKGLGDKDIGRVLVVILLGVVLVRIGSILTNFLYFLLNPKYGERI